MSTRRAKIRPPRKNLLSEVDFDSYWSKLSLAIQQILQKNASQLSFEELYRTAYMLVLKKYASQLYLNTKNEIRKYLETDVATELVPLVKDASSPSQIFKAINSRWSDHCFCMRLISDVLMYLDRVYATEERLPLTYDAGITLFRDAVIRNGDPQVGMQLYDIIINEIQRERNGESIDRITIKNVVAMLETLPESRLDGDSVYVAEFEPRLEESTEQFYRSAATDLLESDGDSAVYLRKVKQWIEDETTRCNLYLADSTLDKMIRVMDHNLIINQITTVVERPSGMPNWIENDKFDEMKLLYQLVSRVTTTHDDIRQFVTHSILASGRELNQQAAMATETAKRAKAEGSKADKSSTMNPTAISINWVESVLQLKDKYDKILRLSFDRNNGLQMVMENAFAKFVNENPKAAEFLSLFVDDNLKKSLKGKTDEEVEQVLEKAIVLFRFIGDKDLFETYFKAHLAKRLLNNKSVSTDAERNMIAKVKMEVGNTFTSKLEGMFKDMEISRGLMSEFKQSESSQSAPIEINVNMLTSSYWPTSVVSSQSRCVYPEPVTRAKEAFEKFYLNRHNGRTLTWNPNMGTADVKARFKKKTHEINMPTYAMTILMLFNDLEDGGSLSFEDIKNGTSIPEADLVRHLLSISVAPKTRLLRKEPMSKSIKNDDRFSVNDKFESPMTRIKVLTVSSSSKVESDQERRQTLDQINKSRKYETDAAIVRIMKYVYCKFLLKRSKKKKRLTEFKRARKSLDHANLIAEVTRQLASRFKPDPAAIKLQIDALLEREYLERDPESRAVYNYLA